MKQSTSVLDFVPELRHGVLRRSVRDLVAEKIAVLIAWGILQVGDCLPSERELASAFRVSRETVRGGMQILAMHGIIEIAQGARTRVISADVERVAIRRGEANRINSYDLDAVHKARLVVEPPVVADATLRIDDATLLRLEEVLDQQRQTTGDPVRFLILDREFHLAIYRASGNAALADFVSDLYAYMMEYRRKAMGEPGAILESYQQHRAIMARLRERDVEGVVLAFRRHTDRINATTRSILGSSAGGRPLNQRRRIRAQANDTPAKRQ